MAESPLTNQQLKALRQALIDRRQEVLGDLKGVREELGDENRSQQREPSAAATHPADVGTERFEQQLDQRLAETERDLLLKIDEALARIEQGTYGRCEVDGEAISIERLRARPWARRCLQHAEPTT